MTSTVLVLFCLVQTLLCTISYVEIVLDASYTFFDNSTQLSVSFGTNPYVNITITGSGRRGTGIIYYGGNITSGNYTLNTILTGYQNYIVSGHVGRISHLFDTSPVKGAQFDLISTSGSNPYGGGTISI